jgi:hypothetical protein
MSLGVSFEVATRDFNLEESFITNALKIFPPTIQPFHSNSTE